jgi:hypothetical protein
MNKSFPSYIGSANVLGPIDELLAGSSVLVIDIPPKLRGNQSGDWER